MTHLAITEPSSELPSLQFSLAPHTSVQPSLRLESDGGRWRWEERLVRFVGRWMEAVEGSNGAMVEGVW